MAEQEEVWFEQRVRALFEGERVRRVWRDGVSFVEVPEADLQEALDPGMAESVETVQARSLLAIMGGTLDGQIRNAEYRLARVGGESEDREHLQHQLKLLRMARDIREREQPEVHELVEKGESARHVSAWGQPGRPPVEESTREP